MPRLKLFEVFVFYYQIVRLDQHLMSLLEKDELRITFKIHSRVVDLIKILKSDEPLR